MTDKTFIRHTFFNMLKIFRRTRTIATDPNANTRTHTNSTTMDNEHILIGTNFTQVLFASTRKLTSGVVRLCEGAFRFTLSVSSPMRTNYTNIPTGESRIQIEHIHIGCSNYINQEMRTHLKF